MAYHYLSDRRLPDYMTIDIVDEGEGDNARQVVYVNSSIHVDKRYRMPVSYRHSWTHAEILSDGHLAKRVQQQFPDALKCPCCGR